MSNIRTADSLFGKESQLPDSFRPIDARGLEMDSPKFNKDHGVPPTVNHDVELTQATPGDRRANLNAVLRTAVDKDGNLRAFSETADQIFLNSIDFNGRDVSFTVAKDFQSIAGSDERISQKELLSAFKNSLKGNDINKAAQLYAVLRTFETVGKLSNDDWFYDIDISREDIGKLSVKVAPELNFAGQYSVSLGRRDHAASASSYMLGAAAVYSANPFSGTALAAGATIAQGYSIYKGWTEYNKEAGFLKGLYPQGK